MYCILWRKRHESYSDQGGKENSTVELLFNAFRPQGYQVLVNGIPFNIAEGKALKMKDVQWAWQIRLNKSFAVIYAFPLGNYHW